MRKVKSPCNNKANKSGPKKKEDLNVAEKTCKHHPKKAAVLMKNGNSTGLCQECISKRGKKGGATGKRKPKGG